MDQVVIAGRGFRSRLFVGTGKYRSFPEMARCHEASGAEVVTVAVRPVTVSQQSETQAVIATGLGSTVNLRLPQTSGVPEATENVNLSLNLSAYSSVPKEASRFTPDTPYAFDRFDPGTYNNSTQTTIYDASGNPLTMTSYFVRETSASPSSWSVYTFVGDKQLGTDPANPAPITLTFDSSGALTAPTAPTQFAPFTVGTSTTEQTIALDFGSATTQLGAPFSVNNRSQDGKAVGQLDGVTVGEDGTVSVTTLGNPAPQIIGNIQTADFINPAGLQAIGGNLFLETAASGAPQVVTPGLNGFGTTLQQTLENSNVSTVEELVNMITTQRAYEMNSKVISTADQMLQYISQNL